MKRIRNMAKAFTVDFCKIKEGKKEMDIILSMEDMVIDNFFSRGGITVYVSPPRVDDIVWYGESKFKVTHKDTVHIPHKITIRKTKGTISEGEIVEGDCLIIQE